jgi:hypothetical protein
VECVRTGFVGVSLEGGDERGILLLERVSGFVDRTSRC